VARGATATIAGATGTAAGIATGTDTGIATGATEAELD
jgi:hypothetical protein